MAQLQIEFFSNSLCRPVQFKMIIPNDPMTMWGGAPEEKPLKTIFLLHGYTGAASNWIPEYYCSMYNFAIVMPSGENAFWIDGMSTGHKFETFLAIELVDYVRKTFRLAMTAEETYIMGMSMGGYGAIHTALAHPDRFSKAIALSSALIYHDIASMKPGDDNGMSNYDYYVECFGDLTQVEKSRKNPEVLIDEILADDTKKMPQLLLAVGTQDFLLENNRIFHKYLLDKGVEHLYTESKGGHDMIFWDEYAKKYVPMLFE